MICVPLEAKGLSNVSKRQLTDLYFRFCNEFWYYLCKYTTYPEACFETEAQLCYTCSKHLLNFGFMNTLNLDLTLTKFCGRSMRQNI